MEEWDAQTMLDLYIYDYLLRKNLYTTANSFLQEANIPLRSVVMNHPEGFLFDWWSIFWDVYCSRPGNNPSDEQASTSMLFQPPQTSTSILQSAQLVSPSTNVNCMLQNICPSMSGSEFPNMLQAGNSTLIPKPETGSLLSVIPPTILNHTLNARDVEHFSCMQPSGSSSGPDFHNWHQSPLSRGLDIGTGLGRPTASELTPPAPKLILDSAKQADSGCQADRGYEWAARASESEPSTRVVSPTILDDGSKGKVLQIEKSTENEKQADEDIGHFLSVPENMNMSFTHTYFTTTFFSLEKGAARFLAAAGHEKKVILWNLSLSSRETLQGHTQLITDVRFQPKSTIFATSSFDKTVKIWDAINTNIILSNLVGHEDLVTSVDFHPKSPNLLCSCDSNDMISLWNIKESTCFGFYKGGNKQVRFQPRQGNLLAAVTGNIINLINVETGVIQQRFEGHEKEIRSMCWDVCGEYLVSASEDSTCIWSLVSGGKCVHELHLGGTNFTSCTFHPSYSQVVAIGSYQSVYMWNPMMGSKTWTFPAHQGIISGMANAPETNMMASVSPDHWR